MDSIFKNYDKLISSGNIKLRKDVLSIGDAGVRKVIPYTSVKELVLIDDENIIIGKSKIELSDVGKIFVVGAGKGSYPIAQALDEIFGSRINDGVVIVKEGEKRRLDNIEIFESSHPIPDERSIEAAHKMIKILDKAGENDLIFAAITGGSSALVNKPAGKITIEDLRDMNTSLLNCGADISKINTVRKHICMMKGGRMVQNGQPARVVTITFDTAPPGMPWPDMSLPDPTTFQEAINVLKDYNLWENSPDNIKDYLIHGLDNPELETVKSLDGMNQEIHSVADPRLACESAAKKAQELGYKPYILSTIFEGESKDLGITLAGITDETLTTDRSFNRPCALISGGETTVTIEGTHGEGGPNQEAVLGFLHKIRHDDGYVFLCMDTDGTDGPTEVAGGIVDGYSFKMVVEKNIDLGKYLRNHNSSEVIKLLGGDLVTGHTGTNVMDLRVVLIE